MIREFGIKTRKPGNTVEFGITKKNRERIIRQLKKVIQLMDKTANKRILFDENQKTIITVYQKLT